MKTNPTDILGDDPQVRQIGYATMPLSPPRTWGLPRDRPASLRVLRGAIQLGANLIDTADSHGPHVSEELIAEVLRPCGEHVVMATKAGLARTGPWAGTRWADLSTFGGPAI
jgi:aryl-alcohol dehydrogenase-like predicted oxidoreductase